MPESAQIHRLPVPRVDSNSDGELVRRAQLGDGAAEEALYRRHVRRVILRCHRLVGSKTDAEDVAQDVFVRAFEKLKSLKTPEAFGRWLDRITVHGVLGLLRRRRIVQFLRLEEHPGLPDPICPRASPEVAAELAQLSQVLGRLPPQDRLAWALRYVEGETLPEVARLTQVSLATVKRRIRAAQVRIEAHVQVGAIDG